MASISTTTLDSNGTQRVLSDDIRDIRFVDVKSSLFANPGSSFTGYAANGFYYEDGEPNPLFDPFKAPWAQEGEGDPTADRGDLDRFPDRILIVTTAEEVVILDADTLDVWVRFRRLSTPSGSIYGNFLGDPTVEPRSADFHNGVLVVATSEGLRIADFRKNVCYVLDTVTSYQGLGIEVRGEDGMLEDSVLIGSNRVIQSTACLHVSIGTAGGLVTAAVGHESGLSAVQVAQDDAPTAAAHAFILASMGSWAAVDDGSGDSETALFGDAAADAQSQWVNNGVRIGDLVLTDLPSQHTITDIDVGENVLVLDPVLDTSDSGLNYEIHRIVNVTRMDGSANLYVANGQQKVLRIEPPTWYDGAFDPWEPGSGCVILSEEVTSLNDLVLSGTTVFAATDIGIFRATGEDFERLGQPSVEYIYSAGSTPAEASYEILEGGISDCRAAVIDPETGHLMVAAVDSTTSVLTEIDLSIHQAFRFFTRDNAEEGEIQALVAYRNPDGPPDEEVA
jgi:hypothetical protein